MFGSIGLNRRGATLPLTVIVLALLAVAVAISYARVSTERMISGDSKAQFGAFAVAQSGLNRYLANLNGKPAGNGPWLNTVYNDLPGGTARVDMVMLRESTSTLLPAVYVITSRGRYTAARKYNSLTPSAERTVASYAVWTPEPLDLEGAFTSLSGIVKNGSSGAFSGIDRCVGSGQPNVAGAAVPDGGYSGPVDPIDGIPPYQDAPKELGTGGPGGTARNAVDVDWQGILNGTYFAPNYVAPTLPTTAAQWANWPVVRANGDFDLSTNGKGILIVTNNLTMSGGVGWEGLVLVGGTVTSNGNNSVYGAMISGLNVKLGQVVAASSIANGNKTFQYDSCNLSRALGKIGSIQRIRNGWTDTWSSY